MQSVAFMKDCESTATLMQIDPAFQGNDELEGIGYNKFVDIFRFSSSRLQSFLAAEHIFQAI